MRRMKRSGAVETLVAPRSVETRPLPQAVLTVHDTHATLASGPGETPAIPVSALPLDSAENVVGTTVAASGQEIFGNDLAPETKTARSALP